MGADLRGYRGAFASAAGLPAHLQHNLAIHNDGVVPGIYGRPRLAFTCKAGRIRSDAVSY